MSKIEQLYDLIIRLMEEVKQFDYDNSENFTLNIADIYILKMIRIRSRTITSLTESLSYDKAFISRRVRFLESNGLLIKKPINRKSNEIVITKAGLIMLDNIQARVDRVYHGILTENEIDVLVEIGSNVQQRIRSKNENKNKKRIKES